MKLRGTEVHVSPVLKLALAAGVALHLAAFTLFRIDSRPLPELPTRDSFLAYRAPALGGGPTGLDEQAALMDSAPLFIPTRWNTGIGWQGAASAPGGGSFAAYEPDIDVAGALGLRQFQPSGGEIVSKPEDLLASRFWNLFDDYPYRAQEPEPTGEEAPAVARVRSLSRIGDPPVVLPLDVPGNLPAADTRPPRFSLRIANGLLVGRAVLLAPSGNPDLDGRARAWVESPQTIARLPSGYLEIEVFY